MPRQWRQNINWQQTPMKHLWNTYDEFFKFAFVRNPLDLHVSLYHYLCKNKKHPLSKTVREKSFKEFIGWYIGTDPKTQMDFVADPAGEIIVDFIGKFENISNDYDSIKTKLGLNSSPLSLSVSGLRVEFQVFRLARKAFSNGWTSPYFYCSRFFGVIKFNQL